MDALESPQSKDLIESTFEEFGTIPPETWKSACDIELSYIKGSEGRPGINPLDTRFLYYDSALRYVTVRADAAISDDWDSGFWLEVDVPMKRLDDWIRSGTSDCPSDQWLAAMSSRLNAKPPRLGTFKFPQSRELADEYVKSQDPLLLRRIFYTETHALPTPRGRLPIRDLQNAQTRGKFNTQLLHYDTEKGLFKIRVDHTSAPQFWIEFTIDKDRLDKWVNWFITEDSQ